MNNRPAPGPAPIVPLLDWEGPVLTGSALAAAGFVQGPDSDPVARTAPELADAIAATVLGNSASETPEEIVSFLAAWRRRYGNNKFADLKKQVLAQTDRQQAGPPQNEALRRAVDQMFDRA